MAQPMEESAEAKVVARLSDVDGSIRVDAAAALERWLGREVALAQPRILVVTYNPQTDVWEGCAQEEWEEKLKAECDQMLSHVKHPRPPELTVHELHHTHWPPLAQLLRTPNFAEATAEFSRIDVNPDAYVLRGVKLPKDWPAFPDVCSLTTCYAVVWAVGGSGPGALEQSVRAAARTMTRKLPNLETLVAGVAGPLAAAANYWAIVRVRPLRPPALDARTATALRQLTETRAAVAAKLNEVAAKLIPPGSSGIFISEAWFESTLTPERDVALEYHHHVAMQPTHGVALSPDGYRAFMNLGPTDARGLASFARSPNEFPTVLDPLASVTSYPTYVVHLS